MKIICIILQIILFQIQALYWCETEEKQIECFDLKEIEDQQIECQQTTFNYQNETLYFENEINSLPEIICEKQKKCSYLFSKRISRNYVVSKERK